MKVTRKYRKYLEEFGGARTLAAVGLQLAIVAAPLFLIALVAFAIFHVSGDHKGTALASLGILAYGGTTETDSVPMLTKKLDGLEGEIKTFIQKAEGEIKATGKVSEDTKAALEKQAKQAQEIMERLMAVEQKLTSKTQGEDRVVKSIGELFTDSEGFKALAAGAPRSGKVNVGHLHKTAMVNATGLNQPLVQAYRMPGIITPAQQRLTIRDLFPAIPVSSNMIEYVEETSFTNNAAMQGAGSDPQVFENVAKAESAMAFALKYAPVGTIAHWIPVSKQLLSDAPAISGYINARLLYGLKLKEEGELLNGTGTGADLKGVLTCATAYETTRNVSGDTRIDTLRHAIAQTDASFYPSEFIVVNPADWEAIELIKTTGTASSGEYIIADPRSANPKRLWGKPVVDTPSMAAGKFLVGSSMAATIWDRDDATIEISREHSDYFVRNMAAILCESRVGLTVQVPKALVYGSFPS